LRGEITVSVAATCESEQREGSSCGAGLSHL
jgi:hypothetical protein